MKKYYLSLITLMGIIVNVQSIWFYLEPNQQKCLNEEVQADVLFVGEYFVPQAYGQKVSCKISDSKDHILTQVTDIIDGKKGKLTFVTETYDEIKVCFTSHVSPDHRGQKQEIMLEIKKGNEAKSYEALAEAAKLKPIEVELKRMEDLSESIVQDFARMQLREKQMRDTNETTNSRVLYFSIFSMCCLLGLATWQVFYLRRFFRAKKLIE